MGNPDYRSMARRAGCAPSTLSTAAAGRRFPTLEATLAFVRACRGDQSAQAEWARRWQAVKKELSEDSAPPASPAATAPDTEPRPAPHAPEPNLPPSPDAVPASSGRRPRRLVRAVAASCVVLAATAGALAVARDDGHQPTHRPSGAGTSTGTGADTGGTVVDEVPVRRQGTLQLVPDQVVDLDSMARGWGVTGDPGPPSADVEFESGRALTGLRNADMAVLPPGKAGTFTNCADEQDYGVKLAASAIRTGRVLCDITSDDLVAMLRVTGVRKDETGAPDRVSFRVVVWNRRHLD
ncbi:hypothetical protein [Streptomyces sasae]|uniref:hypothetical protein n=1 Tax=Streptomyces sasae TaxID=1266772 RepID=UPI0029306606|nr:hypothetical protein [Streptomyces sasae]